MNHEAAPRLDGATEMHRCVGRNAGLDRELAKQIVQPEAGNRRAEPDADRTIGVVRADRDDGMFEAWVADPGHCEQELASQIGCVFHNMAILAALWRARTLEIRTRL